MQFDTHNSPVTYLQLAVTDRCNLRCFYCMPKAGIRYLLNHPLLTFEEIKRVVRVLIRLGVSKVRVTGGEPFVRAGLINFLHRLSASSELSGLSITTNCVLTGPYVIDWSGLGVKVVNLSLNTLGRQRFHVITRRDELPAILDALDKLLTAGMQTKINAVVMDGQPPRI